MDNEEEMKKEFFDLKEQYGEAKNELIYAKEYESGQKVIYASLEDSQTVKSYENRLQELKTKVKTAYLKLIKLNSDYKNEEYDHEFLSDD